jgi:hypothetical protein
MNRIFRAVAKRRHPEAILERLEAVVEEGSKSAAKE